MMAQWMVQPHWQEWWGTDTQADLAKMRAKASGESTTRAFLFHADKSPIGYVQYWIAQDAKTGADLADYPWLADLDDHTVGIDISIGPAGLLGRGYGLRALASFTDYLNSLGYDDLVVDPDKSNLRAIRAYEKAGFRAIPAYQSSAHSQLLMRHRKDTQ